MAQLHWFLKPLLVVLTLGLLTTALLQSVGRLGLGVLDEFESAVNQLLAAQDVRLTGLSGSWRLLNPVIRADRVDFPAGHVGPVTVEFDWLESLMRNRLVARRLAVGQGMVELEPDGSGGWQLVGVAAGGDMDISGLLYQSDQLQVALSVLLRGSSGDVAAAYMLDYRATNRGGAHRHRLSVANKALLADGESTAGGGVTRVCKGACGGRIELQVRESLWPMWQEEVRVTGDLAGLDIPMAFAELTKFQLAKLSFAWQRVDRVSGGHFSVHIQDAVLPEEITLSVRLGGRFSGSGDSQHGVIDEFRWAHHRLQDPEVSGSWELPELRVRVEPGFAEAWAGSMDLARAAEFFEGALAGIDMPSRWLRELKVDATALNVRGRLDWPSRELSFAASLADLNINGYKGVPYLRGLAGELIGYRRGAQLNLNSQNIAAQFPATFRDKWNLEYVQGVVQLWLKDGYLGVRGPDVRLRTPTHRVVGSFAITRPVDRSEERLTLLIDMGDVELAQARTYVPYTLSEGLRQWLREAPQLGVFGQPRFGYHGHVHLQPGVLSRRVELTSELRDATVRYHRDWPEISGLFGRVVVAGATTRVEVSKAMTAGAELMPGSLVVLGNGAAYADVGLISQLHTDSAINFIRNTPLADSMSWVDPQWTAGGRLVLNGDLHIPLGTDSSRDELRVDLTVGMSEAALVMPELRLAFDNLDGELHYGYPNTLQASRITGTTFDKPAAISARTSAGSMVLRVQGSATHEDVLYVLEMEDPEVVSGHMDFVADLFIGGDDADTRLEIASDLVGAELALPGEFAKAAQVSRPFDVGVHFLDGLQVVDFSHVGAQGWLHIDGQPVRGAIGFNVLPPELDDAADYLLLTGQVDGFTLDAVVPDDGDTSKALLPIKLANFRVAAVEVGDVRITDVILNGDITATGFDINVASTMIGADFRQDAEQPLFADVDYVVLPESENEDEDPLSVSMIADLPDARVEIQSLWVGELDYGRWTFDILPTETGVAFVDLDAELRDLKIKGSEGVRWSEGENRSYFVGEVQVSDMADVLPHWGFAPGVETESGLVAGDVSWSGSPVNLDLLRIAGKAKVQAINGRLTDVESGGGAMKIFSLMNFNTITKRIRGDFSDLTGKGLAFDTLEATIEIDEGHMEFVESLKVTGTGSRFEVGGSVNLIGGTLDNEMIVTLPVNKSLPWYGVYLALANPLAGAGIIIGERVLRKPLEQFSSAKYQIGGTFDEPTVNLVNVFDTSMSEAGAKEVPGDIEPVLETEHNAVSDEQERSEI